jgi:tRNA (mo5U34)-methyltransferase
MTMPFRSFMRKLRSSYRKRLAHHPLPENGFTPSLIAIPTLDTLTDADLRQLNAIVKWNAFTVDSRGRRFGDYARSGKREEPQPIPDRRIALFNEEFGLDGKNVLEMGCFEGIHTIGLVQAGAQVIAIDSRMENIVKAVLRCHFYSASADFRRIDVELPDEFATLPSVDLVHHIGVLYHLVDPVGHLEALAPKVGQGLMLDTHVASVNNATDIYEAGGRRYHCLRVGEGGLDDVFAGMYDHARWLLLPELLDLLMDLGFKNVRVHEERAERNGPRVLIFAHR